MRGLGLAIVRDIIKAHGGQTEVVPIGSGEPVSPYEKALLTVVKGWALR